MSDATTTLLWAVGRGAGAGAMLLLTLSMLLGLLSWSRLASARWPRFLTTGVHRNVSLLGLGFVVLHLVTMVLDRFAHVAWIDAVVPFRAGYEALWVGLGTIALDLLILVNATSLAQRRLGWRRWRAIHWAAYACWPLAALHAVGSGTDARATWLLGGLATCLALLVPATLARVARARAGGPALRVGLAAGTLVAAVAGVLAVGQTGIGRHAAASAARVAPAPAAAVAAAASAPAFPLALHGRLTSEVARDGSARAMIDGTVGEGDAAGRLRTVITGTLAGDGLVPSRIEVAYADGAGAFAGTGDLVAADEITADLQRGDERLRLVIHLGVDAGSGTVTGTVDEAAADGATRA